MIDEFAIAPDAPAPEPDEWSGPFWAGLAERRIVIQVCPACERHRFPRMPACPYCAAAGGADIEVPGTGTVYSFIRAHRALTPASAAIVPYAVATVDLDGGARMFGRVLPTEDCAIGVRVEPAFVDHRATDHGGPWTELCFRIAGPT
jgi:uncharacterized OB-fold protein